MPNQLIHESSPYLLQHAHNPVDWHAWNAAALQLARTVNKPLLLSIGYSACHWCHVMAHESFEDAAIAKVMNQHFVCIKVDREERPDLDKIYQFAHQMLSQRPGGWPLTVALTPQGHAPFFAGTYFPPTARLHLPGFAEVLEQVAEHFAANQTALQDYHHKFTHALQQLNPTRTAATPQNLLPRAVAMLARQFDADYGGFGSAPKFPHPTQVQLLLMQASEVPADADTDVQAEAHEPAPNRHSARDMAYETLRSMADGGLYDQLGGGFFRYTVDAQWTIPHFEKMLYDNAQLLGLYGDAWQLFQHAPFAATARATAHWVIHAMQLADGGYAATVDADSTEGEGQYYVWAEAELRAALSPAQYRTLAQYYGLHGEPNFEGKWHFNVALTSPASADDSLAISNATSSTTSFELHTSQQILLRTRQQRSPPARDDKILTAWNGLMIRGMARAGRMLACESFIDSAARSADFMRAKLWQNARFAASYRNGTATLNGYLDDYAFMLEGLLELLQARWRADDLAFARAIADAMLTHFEDAEGGFFFTAHDHETLLYRPKSGADDAIPSGNAAAIAGLLKLGYLLAESRYLHSAETALGLFAAELDRQPSVNAAMTIAAQYAVQHTQVILSGEPASVGAWQRWCNQQYWPYTSVYAIDAPTPAIPASQTPPPTGAIAVVCRGLHCEAPIDNLPQLQQTLP